MVQRIVLLVAVFLIILLALSFGETIFAAFFSWINWLSGKAVINFTGLSQHVTSYVQANALKVMIAVVLTLAISYWISRPQQSEAKYTFSKRKISIFLAVFLGWLGLHRFYIGHYVVGMMYVITFYLFTPIAVLLALMDAVRFFTMSDDEFLLRFR